MRSVVSGERGIVAIGNPSAGFWHVPHVLGRELLQTPRELRGMLFEVVLCE